MIKFLILYKKLNNFVYNNIKLFNKYNNNK